MSSILEKIVIQRRKDVEEAKAKTSLEQLKTTISVNQTNNTYSLLNFHAKLKDNAAKGITSVMAEVKRASPSKGDIAPGINAAEQGLQYANAGATVISCLTEPTWFKGTLEDMRGIREAIESLGNSRPALLRKDFLIDEYQIYEARANGADTILLIVAAFTPDECESKLSHLISVSRSLNMEPLVEVNSADELRTALKLGSKVIGVNNRNLHNFQVDLNTTSRLINDVAMPDDVIMAALSGISTRSDVEFFESAGVKAVLVGESLMRANLPKEKIRELRGERPPVLVKICGVLDAEMAVAVAESGADMIGLVFAKESRRKLTVEKAVEISEAIKKWRTNKLCIIQVDNDSKDPQEWLTKNAQNLANAAKRFKPLLVGVFADNDLEEVNKIAKEVPLDLIQLSGHEGFASTNNTIVPSVKAVHVSNTMNSEEIIKLVAPGNQLISILLDTQDPQVKGGTGRAFDWNIAKDLAEKVPFFLAGGLNPDNISEAVKKSNPFAVDVSSGVETDGKKDLTKVKQFIQLAKQ